MQLKKVVYFDLGEVFYCEENGMYNVYTRSTGYGDFIFQFGVSVKDCPDIVKIIFDNLYNENLTFVED